MSQSYIVAAWVVWLHAPTQAALAAAWASLPTTDGSVVAEPESGPLSTGPEVSSWGTVALRVTASSEEEAVTKAQDLLAGALGEGLAHRVDGGHPGTPEEPVTWQALRADVEAAGRVTEFAAARCAVSDDYAWVQALAREGVIVQSTVSMGWRAVVGPHVEDGAYRLLRTDGATPCAALWRSASGRHGAAAMYEPLAGRWWLATDYDVSGKK